MMKIWPWGSNPDYAVKVEQGLPRASGAGRSSSKAAPWRSRAVKGWDSAENARTACNKVLDGIGAQHVHEDDESEAEK